MPTDFVLFGPAHLLVLAAIPAAAGGAAWLARRSAGGAARLAAALGVSLAANELIWYAYRWRTEGNRFPEGLPLQLCDLALWMAVAALVTRKPWCYEVAYYAGIGGSGMAVLTPDLWAPCWSYPPRTFSWRTEG
jgi:hypothetical integral membrane protein (TIGR02206 family)